MATWEDKLREWAKPPGVTEEQRCANAEKAIRNAIQSSDKLKDRNIRVFTQGSYRNNTNVRHNSDVDIGVLCFDTFFHQLPEGYGGERFGIEPATYHYAQFKDEVEEALRSHFPSGVVTRGNKAINVRETSYHVEADVAPFFEHRRYSTTGTYHSGVELQPDRGERVINWPEQHYTNGVNKNNATGRRFKAMVRTVKSLAVEMERRNLKTVPGFLIECFVWNVPNNFFGNQLYTQDLKNILGFLYEKLGLQESDEWGEVSELKYLFKGPQKWTKAEARQFTVDVWNFVGLSS